MLLSLAISILWFALGVVILGAVVWVALWAVAKIVPMPPIVPQLVWAVFGILCLIALLISLQGGSVGAFAFHRLT